MVSNTDNNNNTQNLMIENNFRSNCILAKRRHDTIVAAGRNPTLADVRAELFRLDGLRCTENDVAGFVLGEPLDAGRRGLTGKSLQADAATRRAAELSEQAEASDNQDLHEQARQAHADARSYHRACANYHDVQVTYHKSKANPTPAEASMARKLHCDACDTDFELGPIALDNEDSVECPNCGESVDTASATDPAKALPEPLPESTTNTQFGRSHQPTPQDLIDKAAGRTPLASSSAPDFVPVELHCPNCKYDFPEVAGKLDDKLHYTCPNCGSYLSHELAQRANTEAIKQAAGLSGSHAADFAKVKCHCANCKCEFDSSDGKLDLDSHYTCPECGAYLEKGAAEMENSECLKQAQGSRQTADAPLCCARSLPSLLAGELADTLCYMPAGQHLISPSQGGKPVSVLVVINEDSAARIEAQRAALEAQGGKPFFSVQHCTQIAAFWPTKFFWDTRPGADGKMVTGVWAQGEWSAAGREAVEGKNFRSFSPTFFVDKISTDPENPAHVQFNPNAKLNMGALENDPAFEKMPPLWQDTQARA